MDPIDSTSAGYCVWTQFIELVRYIVYGPNWLELVQDIYEPNW